MRQCVRLSSPSAFTVLSLIILSLLAAWPVLDLTYTIIRFGTELTPDGAGYNFPPQACLPPFILLSILGPLTLLSRLRILAVLMLVIIGIAVTTSLLIVVAVLADLTTTPELAELPNLLALGFAACLILLAMPVARWACRNPKAA